MTNWFVNKEEIKNKTINAIMGELGYLTDRRRKSQTANYWIDNVHNVFAFINDNGDDDRWIEIHFELYNDEDMVGDLLVLNTENVSKDELRKEITVIVDTYYCD